MSELSVQLLGDFRLVYHGNPLTTFKTHRLQALFTFLILKPGKPQFRDQIAYAFWSESNEEQARTNLRNLLHLLRQAFPDSNQFIEFAGQIVLWRESASYTFDVQEFERLVAPAPMVLPTRENLDRAIRLYQGDLLPSCYDDWIIPERDRLRRAYQAALESLAELAENSRDYPTALEYIHKLLKSEPIQAAGNRRLIRLYSLMDDQPAALKAFQSYASLLQRELGVHPDLETQDLYEYLIRKKGKETSLPARQKTITLVGRQIEWQKLKTAWQSTINGNPQALFIKGEAGIGKTRLVEELVQWANRQGIRTAVASCYPAEGSLPYSPVVSWLRSQPLPRLETTWLTELARLMPEVLRANPKVTPPSQLSETWQRLRLFEAMARAIIGSRQKCLLVIEDIHWCDLDTLEWLHFLLRFDPHVPLMIVATERSEEILRADHPLKNLQIALSSLGKYTEIELSPLTKPECYQLASQVAQNSTRQVLNPDLSENIFNQSGGNPLFVVEMVRLGDPQTSPGEAANLSLHQSGKVQAVLNRRIGQISAPTRELVSLAATIGREFHVDVLRQAGEVSEEKLIPALDELLQRRIVQETGSDRYDFTHDLLRQAVLSGLSQAHQRLLHRKVANAYLRLDEGTLRQRNAEIANHYEAAGLRLQAVNHYRLAAESAAEVFANADAIHHLKRAVDLAQASGIGDPYGISAAEFTGLLGRLGELQVLNGQNLEAQVTLERALGQPFSAPGLWRSQIYRKLSDAQFQQHNHPQAFAALDQAELSLNLPTTGGSLEERQEWIQIQLARSQLFYWDNQPDQIDALVQNIHPMIEADGRMDQQSELLSIQFMARLRHERYRLSWKTVEIGKQRLALAEKFADPYTLA
jgi:DNA-binding SARP family transcriptional activator